MCWKVPRLLTPGTGCSYAATPKTTKFAHLHVGLAEKLVLQLTFFAISLIRDFVLTWPILVVSVFFSLFCFISQSFCKYSSSYLCLSVFCPFVLLSLCPPFLLSVCPLFLLTSCPSVFLSDQSLISVCH